MSTPFYQIIHSECIPAMRQMRLDGQQFDLVFADPPFNIGVQYQGFSDRMKPQEFRLFTREWLNEAWQLCNGVMALHGPDDLADLYLEFARDYNLRRIGWVNWYFDFGVCTPHNWVGTRCHLLIYAKHPKGKTKGDKGHVWNPKDVTIPSARAKKYNDKRVTAERGGRRLPGTVWGVPADGQHWGRVTGNSKERRPLHKNQLPERYLERIILAYTNPGHVVFDPFGGSGTTPVVSLALGRSCVVTEQSEAYCRSIQYRINQGAVHTGIAYD